MIYLISLFQISNVISAFTAPLRYPGYTDNDLAGIVAALSPLSRCHYVMASYTPFATDLDENYKSTRKASVLDIMRRLLQPKNLLASVGGSRKNSFLSIFDIIRGDVSAQEVHSSLARIKEKKLAQFVPWTPSQINVSISRQPACAKSRISGLMLANNTSITALLKRTLDQFDRLRKRNAFLEQYRREVIFMDNLDEFDSSR